MNIGDKVTFKLHGKEFHYVLTSNYLKNSDDEFANSAIFTELGYDRDSKLTFCEGAYGYKPGTGCCPTCHTDDAAALTRLVEAIKRQCFPFDEIIEFIIDEKTFKYNVQPTHLSGENCSNDAIFKELQVNKVDYCSLAYGYPSKGGCWPCCKDYDYEALLRLIDKLKRDCETETRIRKVTKEPRKYQKDSIISFYVNGRRFEYKVCSNFCAGCDCANDRIFKELGLKSEEEIMDCCESIYGYQPDYGSWPFCKEGDYKALDRLIDNLYAKCALINCRQDLKADYSVKAEAKLPWEEATQIKPEEIVEKAMKEPDPLKCITTETVERIIAYSNITETTLLLPKKHKNTTKF